MENNSLYSPEISHFFHTRQWPKGFLAVIIEKELFLQFIVYRDNFESFDGEDKKQIAMMVKEFMEKVRGMGVPIYMEVKKGDGRAERTGVRMGN